MQNNASERERRERERDRARARARESEDTIVLLCCHCYTKPDARSVDARLFKSQTSSTLIIINFPHNPTGSYLAIDQLRLSLDGLAVRQSPAQMRSTEAEPIVLTGSTFERLGSLLQSLLDRISHLVDFRRGQPGPGPIPTQAEETVLRQNIALSLTTAQIALLRREQVVFERSLDRVSMLLDHYFDPRAEPVISAQSVIKALKTTPLGIDLPSVDHSLGALEAARLNLGERP